MIQRMYNIIRENILQHHEHQLWMLHEPIVIRLSDADYDMIEVVGLSVSPQMDLYVATVEDGHGYPVEMWNKLSPGDKNAEKMITEIFNRVQKIYKPTDVLL